MTGSVVRNGSCGSDCNMDFDINKPDPDEDLNGTAIKKWVEWDSGNTVTTYTGMMRNSSNWGGAIEIAVCAHMKGIQIDVYERNSNGLFKRISSFKPSTAPTNSKSKINVLYGGRCHYDAIIIV